MRNISEKVVEKIKKPNLCSIIPPPPENVALYKIKWKNTIEPDMQQITIWSLRIS
jgi:hypothetical protein